MTRVRQYVRDNKKLHTDIDYNHDKNRLCRKSNKCF